MLLARVRVFALKTPVRGLKKVWITDYKVETNELCAKMFPDAAPPRASTPLISMQNVGEVCLF
jgi:hypothetical protein